jgi:hypothetical protein
MWGCKKKIAAPMLNSPEKNMFRLFDFRKRNRHGHYPRIRFWLGFPAPLLFDLNE